MKTYVLGAQTITFFIAALRYADELLYHLLASLSYDPFLQNIVEKDEVFRALPLYKEYSHIHHLLAWFEATFIVLDGDNRDSLKFMVAFQEQLKAKQRIHLELKKEKYEILMEQNMGQLKAICEIYLSHQNMLRDLIASNEKVSLLDLEEVDKTLQELSEILNADFFPNADISNLKVLSTIAK